MASHGRHGVSAMLIGSETLKVLTCYAEPLRATTSTWTFVRQIDNQTRHWHDVEARTRREDQGYIVMPAMASLASVVRNHDLWRAWRDYGYQ
jgi:hypothetical protein